MPFIRVRQVDGPAHEFDAPLAEVEAHPELYKVLDKAVVDSPRDVVYIQPDTEPKPAPRKKPTPATPKTSVGKTETTSEGEGQ